MRIGEDPDPTGYEEQDPADEREGDAGTVSRLSRTIAQLKRRLLRATAEIERQQHQIDGLEDQRAKLQDDLAVARWKLASTKSRKWWRIGGALSEARRSFGSFLKLPVEIARIVFGHASLPPRPTPRRVASGAVGMDPDTRSTDGHTFRNLSNRSTAAAAAPVVGDILNDSPVLPLLVAAPSTMSLAPPPASTTRDLRVACVLDEMSYESFAPECQLISFAPHNWLEVLEREMPNLLLVESAWRGNGGSWEYKVGSYSYPESVGLPDLTAMILWCRSEGIPTVFWNKEDPVHFEKFREAASLFDVVFTTDANMVERYRELPGPVHRVVAALPFAAQPVIHNPVGALDGRDRLPVFAGAYYRNRHESRRKELDLILDAAKPFGLVIYDRMGGAVSDSFGFPDRFQGNIAGTLPYDEMVDAYRRHRLFLNVNSVSDSPTMFSRRVYELLASGTPVVSTPSVGVEEMFGDVVDIVRTEAEAERAVRRLVEDDDWWLERSLAGIDAVFGRHTYADRLETIANAAGLPVRATKPTVTVVLGTGTDVTSDALAAVEGAVDIVVLPGGPSSLDDPSLPVSHLNVAADADPRDVARALARRSAGEWLAFVDTDADLAALASLGRATRFAHADVYVEAGSNDEMHRYVADLPPSGAVLVSAEFANRSSWIPGAENDVLSLGGRVYAVPTLGG